MDWSREEICPIQNSTAGLFSNAIATHYFSCPPGSLLIELQLPVQSTEIITMATKTWFSKETPDLDVTSFFTRPIPNGRFQGCNEIV